MRAAAAEASQKKSGLFKLFNMKKKLNANTFAGKRPNSTTR